MRILVVALVLIATLPGDARAWGSEGHQIIAEIAEQFLEPATARQIRELLAIENATILAEVSNWADEIRPQRPNTAPWHFVNIPLQAAGYDAARDCPLRDCVVAQIDRFAADLRDRSLPPARRLEALRYVVHFIGDVHQPLHASDNNDRGGNDVRVRFDGRTTNLHAVWDTWILVPAVAGDERSYAMRLAHSITAAEITAWRGGSVVAWANESHDVARRVVYGELPHDGTLPASYEGAALPVVNVQLERAGVRLAAVLNAAFSGMDR